MCGKLSACGIDEESAVCVVRMRLMWSVGWNHVARNLQHVGKIVPAGRYDDVRTPGIGRRSGMRSRTGSGESGVRTSSGIRTKSRTCSGNCISGSHGISFTM